MNDPTVLLLDEPYRALDALTKSVMHEALLEIYYKNRRHRFSSSPTISKRRSFSAIAWWS